MARTKKTEKWSYLVDYVNESTRSRIPLKMWVERAVNAYKQCPLHNSYKENAERYHQSIANSGNREMIECAKNICASIPDSTNDTVFNAVETFVSMAMGGASQFEYLPADTYAEKDPGLIDRLTELAKYFHDDNKIDSLVPEATRQMVVQGQANFFLKPVPDGRFKVILIDAWNMLEDPRASKTNRKRFIGYTEIASWNSLKDEIYKANRGHMISVINDVDQYLDELQGWGPTSGGVWRDQLREDLNIFRDIYNPVKPSESKDDKGKKVSPVEPGYKGDDVEASYIWDTISNVYAVIINRRFIVKVEENPFKKTLQIPYIDDQGQEKTRSSEIEIDSPIVTIPFIRLPWETYPISPLFYCLDDFDAICSMESVMNHNFSIMAPITFQSTSYDAEQMSMLGSVAGQIIEGTMNTLGVMNKSHDMSPILAAIERREQRIKRMMGATDQYELQAMLGNRATASEVSAISSAVAQRLNAPLANIETGIGELVQKMFAMFIIYSDDDSLTFPANGSVATVSKYDLLGRSLVQAKLKSRIRLEEQEQGRNALMVLQTLINAQGINSQAMIATLVPVITRGVISRRQAEAFISPQELDPVALTMAQDEMAALAPQQGIDPNLLQDLSPEEAEMLMAEVGASLPGSAPQNPNVAPADIAPMVDTGVDNFAQGIEANDVAGLI